MIVNHLVEKGHRLAFEDKFYIINDTRQGGNIVSYCRYDK